MRRVIAVASALSAAAVVAHAQAVAPAPSPWPGYTPQIIRWQEDYSGYGSSSPHAGFPLDVKYIPIGDGDFLTLGGEYRFRVDTFSEPAFGLGHVRDFTAVQHRLMLHADAHLGPDVRVFLQIGGGIEDGRPIPRPGDKGDFDLAQGFVDFSWGPKAARWRLRVGRQEVILGRYIAIRDGTNFPFTLDGVRLDGQIGDWTVLALVANATRQRPHQIDDAASRDSIGVAMVEHPLPIEGFHLDLLALDHNRYNALYAAGRGVERRGTLGARVWGANAGWDVDAQASDQFGTFALPLRPPLDIAAYGAAFEGGRSFNAPLPTRLAIRIDYASGGSARGRLQTFDLPYPNLSYLTDAAVIAPRNVHDVQPFVTVTPVKALALSVGAEFLWRNSRTDSVYTPAFTPVAPPGGRGAFVASQPYVRLDWRATPLVEIQGGLETGIPGEVLKSVGARRDLDFAFTSFTVRF